MLWLALPALAQTDPQDYPFDVERFRPAVDPLGYAAVESGDTLEHLQVGVKLIGSYTQDSVVLVVDGERLIGPAPRFPDAWLDTRTVTHLSVGLGLGGIFSLNVAAPVVVWQTGFEPSAVGSVESQVDPEASGLGDLRIAPKFTLVDLDEDTRIGLALLAVATLPTGETRSLIGEGDYTATPMVAFEAADGDIHSGEYLARGAINVGARLKSPDVIRDLSFGTEFVYQAALAARPIQELEIGADLVGSVAGERRAQLPVEVLPWLKLHGAGVASLMVGGGFGLVNGVGSPDWRLFGGATLAPRFDPSRLDRDHDGIPNRDDACINVPEDADGFQDEDGCPDADNDGDGLADAVDACRDDPEDFDGHEDADGCPDLDNDGDGVFDETDRCPDDPEDLDGFQDLDGCPEFDNDGDGIPDGADACPNAAENFNGVLDADGCPEDWVDTDKDGFHDAVDACPYDAEDTDGFQDEDGCPDVDNDRDGVLDVVDQCPFEPENQNNFLDEDGCPDAAPERVVVQREKIVITEKVFFEYNRAVIQRMSFDLLDEVARVINDHPRITLIQVEGHTDGDGTDAYNERLSQARAESVLDYLARAGVDPLRLTAKGFGESLPIDANDTDDGKARNRRVEFTILEQE